MPTNAVGSSASTEQANTRSRSSTRLLEYFGELFPSSECKRMRRTVCDNCRQVLKTTTIDCTQMSIDIIKLVSEFSHKNITLPYALEILRGANTKVIRDAGHNTLPAYNSCSQLNRVGR